MKLESILSQLAAPGVILAFSGLAWNALALWLFSAAAVLLVLLVATCDDARGTTDGAALATVSRRAEVMPLAA